MTRPKGVRYEPHEFQSLDYQVFPEEFFSGADVTIYFGDSWIDDVTSISFQMSEAVRPIFGYASYTWDAVARGQRQIQGHFAIAFRESGYLNNLVLDHLAQMKVAKPAVAWLMDPNAKPAADGDLVPKFHARARERIDGLLNRYHSPMITGQTEEREEIPRWPDLTPTAKNPDWAIKELAEALFRRKDAQGRAYYPEFDSARQRWSYDVPLQAAVKRFQLEADVRDDASGVVGAATKEKLAVKKLVKSAVYDTTRSLAGTAVREDQTTKSRAARYEAEVWGLDGATFTGSNMQNVPLRAMRRFKPYWYSGASEGPKVGTEALAQKGFDVYFSFGALDAHVAMQYGNDPYNRPLTSGAVYNKPDVNDVTYPTTVRALRNVQIVGVGMGLDSSGRPVEEVYQFIAQDLD